MASNVKNFELAFVDDCKVRLRSSLLHLSLVCSLPEIRRMIDESLESVFSECSEDLPEDVCN